ncbi:hypothetical protein VFPPC_16259 [Pochonia chlamydosporia 170]|uniref:Uncharacterized protein n=1 Tax=Pochonia chlamydosporia 170 TaxID=1380566 RepID=A0A179FHR1_METCM|nr:hypothetical protein VFPPC_16259 [Pochonia chlamydosporia 170]OAQ64808.2 hypothetical protein VFPPC_16259 [Pochonia chlamydosporia 170]
MKGTKGRKLLIRLTTPQTSEAQPAHAVVRHVRSRAPVSGSLLPALMPGARAHLGLLEADGVGRWWGNILGRGAY